MSFLRDSQHDKHFYPTKVILFLLEWRDGRKGAAAGEMVGKNKFRTLMIMAADASRTIQ